MANTTDTSDGLKLTDQATLDLLSVLEVEEAVTQRSLALRIGVALGLTNSLLKRCIHKGLVKVIQAPAKRYSYYVTPKGFGEKSRLVAEYLSTSLSFFRQAKDEYGNLFGRLKKRGIDRVVLCGVGELAEIAILAAHEQEIEIQAILHHGSNQEQFCGYPVLNHTDALDDGKVDAIILAGTESPQDAFDGLCVKFSETKVHYVPLLHITRTKMKETANG